MAVSASLNSPCINVCVINAETGQCFGCFRTIDEISDWPKYSSAEKAALLAALEHRRAAADPIE